MCTTLDIVFVDSGEELLHASTRLQTDISLCIYTLTRWYTKIMLTVEENNLLKIQAVGFFSSSLVGIFTQFYVFKYLDFKGLVLYNFVQFVSLLVLYIASGYLLNKFSTKSLIKSSLLLTTLSYVLLLVFKERALDYIIVLGIISGSAAGLYWSGYNLSQYILTHAHSREHFFGRFMSVLNFASALAPLLGGLIVSYFGYTPLFAIVAALNLALYFMANRLPQHHGVEFSVSHLLSHVRSRRWVNSLKQNAVLGVYDTGLSMFIGVLLFVVLQDPTVVGFTRSAFYLISAIAGMFAGKIIASHKNITILMGILAMVGFVIIGISQSTLAVILFGILTGVSLPIIYVRYSSEILNAIDDNDSSWKNKYEMFIERDLALGVTRIGSLFLLLVLFTYFDKNVVAQWWMIVFSVFPLILGIMVTKNTTH